MRHIDRKGDAGEPRARPHVDQRPRPIKECSVIRRQAVDDMLDRDILGRGERREIHARIPVEQHFMVDRKLPDLLRRQRDARLCRARR